MDNNKSLADANKTDNNDSAAMPHTVQPTEQQTSSNTQKQDSQDQKESLNPPKLEKTPQRETKSAAPQSQSHHPDEKVAAHVENQSYTKQIRHGAPTYVRLARKLKSIRASAIKAKLNHYIFEYKRVLSLARKPTKSEYKELAIMVAVGTGIIGGIGFVVQLIIQFI